MTKAELIKENKRLTRALKRVTRARANLVVRCEVHSKTFTSMLASNIKEKQKNEDLFQTIYNIRAEHKELTAEFFKQDRQLKQVKESLVKRARRVNELEDREFDLQAIQSGLLKEVQFLMRKSEGWECQNRQLQDKIDRLEDQ